jgi:DNA-directed RNA polymerase specialized sigma24 family protein
MAATGSTDTDGRSLVAAARPGDERAFVELTSPLRPALHAHCYRLLGSVHDADDGLQETLLRAWRGIERFEPRAPLAAWLHRIATNVCLRMIEQRARTPAPIDLHLEPYPEQGLQLVQHSAREVGCQPARHLPRAAKSAAAPTGRCARSRRTSAPAA